MTRLTDCDETDNTDGRMSRSNELLPLRLKQMNENSKWNGPDALRLVQSPRKVKKELTINIVLTIGKQNDYARSDANRCDERGRSESHL